MPDRPVITHCVECGQDFTDLEEYQAHVHRATGEGCGWVCLLTVLAWVAVVVIVVVTLRLAGRF